MWHWWHATAVYEAPWPTSISTWKAYLLVKKWYLFDHTCILTLRDLAAQVNKLSSDVTFKYSSFVFLCIIYCIDSLEVVQLHLSANANLDKQLNLRLSDKFVKYNQECFSELADTRRKVSNVRGRSSLKCTQCRRLLLAGGFKCRHQMFLREKTIKLTTCWGRNAFMWCYVCTSNGAQMLQVGWWVLLG